MLLRLCSEHLKDAKRSNALFRLWLQRRYWRVVQAQFWPVKLEQAAPVPPTRHIRGGCGAYSGTRIGVRVKHNFVVRVKNGIALNMQIW